MAEAKVIPNGSGTPYVSIFDSSEKPIVDPLTNLPLGVLVTNFQYEFVEVDEDDEEGDTCEITIETNNPDLVDLKALHPQRLLKVQWGWIFDDGTSVSGPLRRVTIEEVKVKYTENGITLTIEGCDPFMAVAKNTPVIKRNGVMLEAWLNYVSAGAGLEVVQYDTKKVTSSKEGVR